MTWLITPRANQPVRDPYFRDTVLLLNGDGANGAQNNTFIDSSGSNFAITRNGNVTQGSFSPYGDRWSAYFDGTGDYLSISGNSVISTTGDFTVEAWAYPTVVADQTLFYIRGNSISYAAVRIGLSTSRAYLLASTAGNTWQIASGVISASSVPLSTWTHIALTRQGGTFTLYINGASVYTSTAISAGTALMTGSVNYLGAVDNSGLSEFFSGYISSARVINGTALYTSNFTPPTTPLTAITNTSLLTCHANRFVDGSSNNFTITSNGDTRVERFSPFAPSAEYSTSVIGGSAYFDGSVDYLSFAKSTAFVFGNGNFTIEAHVYLNSLASPATLYHVWSGSGATQELLFIINSTSITLTYNTGSVYQSLNPSHTFALNQWVHVAGVRDSTLLRLFVNGVQIGTLNVGTTSIQDTANNTVLVGYKADTANSTNGYISNLRILKGTALYNSNFTPPTAPLTAVTNASLLLNAVNGGIVDATAGNVLETVGNAQASTTQKQYGTGALSFDGSGDYLISRSNAAYNFPGDFTIECWIFQNTVAGTQGVVVKRRLDNAEAGTWGISVNAGTFFFHKLETVVISTNFGVSAVNTWQHIAVSRQGATIRMFLNGRLNASVTDTTDYTNTRNLVIGAWDGFSADTPGQNWFNGYIDDLRITKGVARYTTNFTPPATALQLL